MKIALILLVSLTVTGCDDLANQISGQSSTQSAASKTQPQTPIRRFDLIDREPGVAFDTQTGQICRTWEWKPSGPEPKADNTGSRPQRQLGEFAPTCISLYQDYKTGSDPNDPLGVLNTSTK